MRLLIISLPSSHPYPYSYCYSYCYYYFTGPSITINEMEYVIWEESYNYVVPWNGPEDVSTLIESKAAVTYPSHCGLYSKSEAADQPFKHRRS